MPETSLADVRRLRSASSAVVELARSDLEGIWDALQGLPPEAIRDALLDAVPALVREYGQVAATVAADWYEELRAEQGLGEYRAWTSEGIDPERVISTTRWAAGELWGDSPTNTLSILTGSIQRYIQYSNRETIARNVETDPAKPRYARIPTRADPCNFCRAMASRGFVYKSEATAQGKEDYHDDCGCGIVASFDADQAVIDGYDPDAFFNEYKEARREAGSGSLKDILSKMREANGGK